MTDLLCFCFSQAPIKVIAGDKLDSYLKATAQRIAPHAYAPLVFQGLLRIGD